MLSDITLYKHHSVLSKLLPELGQGFLGDPRKLLTNLKLFNPIKCKGCGRVKKVPTPGMKSECGIYVLNCF